MAVFAAGVFFTAGMAGLGFGKGLLAKFGSGTLGKVLGGVVKGASLGAVSGGLGSAITGGSFTDGVLKGAALGGAAGGITAGLGVGSGLASGGAGEGSKGLLGKVGSGLGKVLKSDKFTDVLAASAPAAISGVGRGIAEGAAMSQQLAEEERVRQSYGPLSPEDRRRLGMASGESGGRDSVESTADGILAGLNNDRVAPQGSAAGSSPGVGRGVGAGGGITPEKLLQEAMNLRIGGGVTV